MNNIRPALLVAAVATVAILVHTLLKASKRTRTGNNLDAFDRFAIVTLANFIVFWWVGVLAGGDALAGKIEGDQYFLSDHGRYTAVGRTFWIYSLIHTWLTSLSFGGMFVGVLVRAFSGKGHALDDDEPHRRGRGTV